VTVSSLVLRQKQRTLVWSVSLLSSSKNDLMAGLRMRVLLLTEELGYLSVIIRGGQYLPVELIKFVFSKLERFSYVPRFNFITFFQVRNRPRHPQNFQAASIGKM